MAPLLSHKRQVVPQPGICLPELWARQPGRDNPGEHELCALRELGVAVGNRKALAAFREQQHVLLQVSPNRSASRPVTAQNLPCFALPWLIVGTADLFLLFGTLCQAPLVFTLQSFPSSAQDTQLSFLGLKSVF